MPSPASFSPRSKTLRIATLLLAAVLWIGMPLPTALAADALTTSSSTDSTTTSTRTSLLKSLFSSKSSSSSTSTSSTGTSSSSQLSRGILGLPIGILKTVASGVSKAATSVVTKHITHY